MTDKKLPFSKSKLERMIKNYPTQFKIYDEKDKRKMRIERILLV